MSFWLNGLGALITIALGLLGLIRPAAAAEFTSMKPVGLLGVSEIRATYGGFFLALGAYALATQNPIVFQCVGLAWAGAAAGRLLSVFLDASREPKNFGGIFFEGSIAALLLV